MQDFLAEAKCSRSLTVLEGQLPAEYLETERKILACQALKDGEPAELIDTLSKSVLAKRFPADATLQVQRSVQCSVSGLGSRGVLLGAETGRCGMLLGVRRCGVFADVGRCGNQGLRFLCKTIRLRCAEIHAEPSCK